MKSSLRGGGDAERPARGAPERAARLAEALRANLKKRRAQKQSRQGAPGPTPPAGGDEPAR